jgi:hypothetical protein
MTCWANITYVGDRYVDYKNSVEIPLKKDTFVTFPDGTTTLKGSYSYVMKLKEYPDFD